MPLYRRNVAAAAVHSRSLPSPRRSVTFESSSLDRQRSNIGGNSSTNEGSKITSHLKNVHF